MNCVSKEIPGSVPVRPVPSRSGPARLKVQDRIFILAVFASSREKVHPG